MSDSNDSERCIGIDSVQKRVELRHLSVLQPNP